MGFNPFARPDGLISACEGTNGGSNPIAWSLPGWLIHRLN